MTNYDEYRCLGESMMDMSEKERMQVGCLAPLCYGLALAIGLLLCWLLGSCRSVQYVEVPKVHTETVHVHDTIRQTDSLWREVSTVIREVDSTELAALGIKLKNLQQDKAWLIERESQQKERSQGDKIMVKEVIKGDSIPVPYPVKEPLSRWQQFCCDYGKFMLGTTAAVVLTTGVLVVLWLRKRRKQS